MNIGSGLNAISRFTVDKTTAAWDFGKDFFKSSWSVCSSLATKVNQFVMRTIPHAVSNTVKAHPKSFAFIAGAAIIGVASTYACNVFVKNKIAAQKKKTDSATQIWRDTLTKLIHQNKHDEVLRLLANPLNPSSPPPIMGL